jgi:AP-3 complex subunit beta
VDEWGQVDLANLLLRYARTMLLRPVEQEEDMDKDVKLLLTSVEPLFMSRNPAVCVCFVLKQRTKM